MSPAPIAELHRLALTVAEEGARMAREMREAGVAIADRKTSVADIVTEADRAVETAIRDAIAAARPQDGFFGEETDEAASASGLTWVVDPIDGTVNYLYGIPAYAVSVAVCRGDVTTPGGYEVVAGAVCNPVTAETFHARKGGGAALRVGADDVPLTVGSAGDLGHALIGTGFAYDPARRAWQGEVVARLLPQVRDIRRIGSAALDLCFVAAGRLDGYYESGTHVWDRAAGELIVREAGGVIAGPNGAASGEELAVAGNAAIVQQLLDIGLRPDTAV